MADELLKELIRIDTVTIRIESHQWFPLKKQLGFHKVVDLVHEVAAQVVLAHMNGLFEDSEPTDEECISINMGIKAIKQHENY